MNHDSIIFEEDDESNYSRASSRRGSVNAPTNEAEKVEKEWIILLLINFDILFLLTPYSYKQIQIKFKMVTLQPPNPNMQA